MTEAGSGIELTAVSKLDEDSSDVQGDKTQNVLQEEAHERQVPDTVQCTGHAHQLYSCESKCACQMV